MGCQVAGGPFVLPAERGEYVVHALVLKRGESWAELHACARLLRNCAKSRGVHFHLLFFSFPFERAALHGGLVNCGQILGLLLLHSGAVEAAKNKYSYTYWEDLANINLKLRNHYRLSKFTNHGNTVWSARKRQCSVKFGCRGMFLYSAGICKVNKFKLSTWHCIEHLFPPHGKPLCNLALMGFFVSWFENAPAETMQWSYIARTVQYAC